MKIVPMATLKVALDITGSEQDAVLTLFEAQAAAIVEKQTQRRFQSPTDRIEYVMGSGTRFLYLDGHIAAADGEVVVLEQYANSGWHDFTDFERRGDKLVRTDGSCWSARAEYELTYSDGYAVAPDDIKALVIELVKQSNDAASAAAGGLTGIDLGEYKERYASSASGAVALSTANAGTLAAYRRIRV